MPCHFLAVMYPPSFALLVPGFSMLTEAGLTDLMYRVRAGCVPETLLTNVAMFVLTDHAGDHPHDLCGFR